MKIRKLVAVLMTVLMLCCIIPFSAMADGTATIDFTDKANRTAYSTEQQVWEQNGITVTNDKGASTSNVGDYGGEGYPARFYKNSTVTIAYPGMTSIVIECRDLESKYVNGWADSAANATASVNGNVVTIVFAEAVDSYTWEPLTAQSRAYTITVITDGGAPVIPDQPIDPSEDPEADTELSIADAIALALSKEHNIYTEGKYFVTGVITEVYNTQYGNMRLTDEAGNILTIYGTYSADGADRYDAMAVKPVAGDTVTIYGIVGQYNGDPQIKNGWIVEHTPAGETPDVPVVPDVPTGNTLTIEEAIVLGLSQAHNVYTADKYYVTGVITEVYNTQYGNMRLTDEAGNILTIYGTYSADGADRYDAMAVKPVAGDTVTIYGIVGQYNGDPQIKNGWIVEHTPAGETPDEPDEPVVPDEPTGDTLTIEEAIALGLSQEHNVFTAEKYYVTGVITEVYNTQYGNMRLTDEAGNILTIYGSYSADGELRYDAMDVKPVAGDTITIYGIIGQYNGTPQVKNGWIVEHTAAGGETPDVPVEPDVPSEPETPDAPATGVVTNPVAGVAYKLGLDQINKGATYYFIGEMNGYYGATDTDVSKAVDMYLEEAEGGYKLYFVDASGAKQYIKLEQSGTHYNFTIQAEGSIFTLDAEKNALCAPCGDQICYMGTYGDYFTMGTLTTEKLKDTDYIARLYAVNAETPDEPGTDSPSTGDNSTVYVTLAVILMALAAAAAVLTAKKRA